MPRRYSKKTRKQSGGAASSPNDDSYKQDDVEAFCSYLIETNKYTGKIGYLANSGGLNTTFFKIAEGSRHETILIPRWTKMVNECYNKFGQTPLYVALRFKAYPEIISILLKNIKNVNRPNEDGSTPLIGLCYGPDPTSRINFKDVSSMINRICSEYGGKLNLSNKFKETPLIILENKSKLGLLDFTE
jgi:hypothetical protein